jgi:monofunctional biosynthetic peptidoglycan transglycosylase
LRGKGVLSDGEYRTAIAQKPNTDGLQRKVDFTIARVEAVQAPMTSVLMLLPGTDGLPAAEGGNGTDSVESPPPAALPEADAPLPRSDAPAIPPLDEPGAER